MTAVNKKVKGFSDAERDAMKERILEVKSGKEDGEKAVLTKISDMPEPDRSLAKQIHVIIKESAPELKPKTWYGMPAYANKDGKVVCFFQPASKFSYKYSTLGFQDAANLDEGVMWPVAFALKDLTDKEKTKISTLVKKAVS